MKNRRKNRFGSIEVLESRQLMAVVTADTKIAQNDPGTDVALTQAASYQPAYVAGAQMASQTLSLTSPGFHDALGGSKSFRKTIPAVGNPINQAGAPNTPANPAQPGSLQPTGDLINPQGISQDLVNPSAEQCEANVLQVASTDPLVRAQSYMDALGITSLSDLGTIHVRAEGGELVWDLAPGIHVLRGENQLLGMTSLQTPPCWTVHETLLTGTLAGGVQADGDLVGQVNSQILNHGPGATRPTGGVGPIHVPSPLGGATAPLQSQHMNFGSSQYIASTNPNSPTSGGPQYSSQFTSGIGSIPTLGAHYYDTSTVVRYEGTLVSDVAVILASKVVFEDAELILSDSVPEFFIVAETIESDDDSIIRWINADTQAEARRNLAPADDGQGFNPHVETSGATFDPRHGEDGEDGNAGREGYEGLDAPDVFVILKSPNVEWELSESGIGGYAVTLPQFDVRGQDGGTGQSGQEGGDGGDGAKGLHAVQRFLLGAPVECKRGAGYGGDGGDGGNGGDGGQGGQGGDGGTISIYYVETPTSASGVDAGWGMGNDRRFPRRGN